MTLLGLDTSMPTASACVACDDGQAYFTPSPEPARLLGPAGHSAELLPEVQRLLDESGTTWDEIESIAVGVGPGTFTGLRIGVSTARGLAQALGVGLRPVSSLEALAAGLATETDTPPGRPLLVLVNARRRQVFAALYRSGRPTSPRKPLPRALALEPIWEPAVVNPESLLDKVHELVEPPLCIGDWAIKSRRELEKVAAEVPAPESGLHAVNALYVCKLAACVEPVAPEQVRPVYLRLPDAEINRRLARKQTH